MSKLSEYVQSHTSRGDCLCSVCQNPSDTTSKVQPAGHTADVFFFKVGLIGAPTKETLQKLVQEHQSAYGEAVNPYDGQEHSYIELGGWIGDQGLAMQFMGLSALLGLGEVFTPNMLPIPDDLKQMMAGRGMVSFFARPEAAA